MATRWAAYIIPMDGLCAYGGKGAPLCARSTNAGTGTPSPARRKGYD